MSRVNQTLGKAKGFMEGFTSGQRSVVVVAVLGLIMGAYAISHLVAQPSWAPLYGNLSGADASAVVTQLNTDGVKYKLSDGGGTVLVPQSQVYAERIALSGKGLPSGSGDDSQGWSLLDKQGITATDFQQNIAYQRAISGELDKTLEAINGVDTAIVHLAVPTKDVFSTSADKTTASVLLSLQPGTTLTNEQVNAVTHLVSGSVASLDPSDVTVTDQTGKLLSSSTSGAAGASGDAGETDQQTAAYEDRLAAAAQAVLDRITGPGHSVVRVNATLDFNSTDSTSTTYAAPSPSAPPLSQAVVTESYSGNGSNAGGTLGQILPTPAVSATGTGNYNRSQSTTNNTLDKTVQNVVTAPGAVQRMTVAVVLDSKTAGALNPTQVQGIIANSVGLNTARGDTVQVSSLPFDTTAAAAAAKELATANKAAKTASYLQIAKKAGIAILVVIILLMLLRRRKETEDSTTIDATASDLLPGGGLLSSGAGAGAQGIGGGQTSALGGGPSLAIASDAERTPEQMRDDVAALVDNQPDDVAEMLQSWLAERKS